MYFLKTLLFLVHLFFLSEPMDITETTVTQQKEDEKSQALKCYWLVQFLINISPLYFSLSGLLLCMIFLHAHTTST